MKGVPRLGSIIGTWFGFNSSQTAPELRALKLSLVAFLFDHRLPDLLLRDWLASCERTLLRATLDREPTMRDEAEVFGKLSKACAKGGKLADLTLAGLSGQTGSPKHLNLITLHSAKGLEFDVVIMMGMEQGRLPSWSATTVEAKREPRRLFYVGLTRAKDEVHLTYSGWTVNRYGRRFENGPSEFLLEVQKMVSEA